MVPITDSNDITLRVPASVGFFNGEGSVGGCGFGGVQVHHFGEVLIADLGGGGGTRYEREMCPFC